VVERLKKQQHDGETISDVINRLLGGSRKKGDLSRFFGLWKDEPDSVFESFDHASLATRESIQKRLDSLLSQ
jgi:predicted CopG family antitoxin